MAKRDGMEFGGIDPIEDEPVDTLAGETADTLVGETADTRVEVKSDDPVELKRKYMEKSYPVGSIHSGQCGGCGEVLDCVEVKVAGIVCECQKKKAG